MIPSYTYSGVLVLSTTEPRMSLGKFKRKRKRKRPGKEKPTRGRHRRRNRGEGPRGHGPPPPNRVPTGKGGSAPTARAMPVHAVIGLTMRYHKISRISSYTKSVLVDLPFVSSLLQPRNSCHSSSIITPNGRGFNEKWVGSKIFRARFARDYR